LRLASVRREEEHCIRSNSAAIAATLRRRAGGRCAVAVRSAGLDYKERWGDQMATYVVLASFTDQGVRNVKDTTKRADAVKEVAKKFGVTAKEFYWTMGAHDVVVIFEAPDDAAMTALSMSVGAAGNVRTQTMRAFTRNEMDGVLAKLG
jgi:uncharacterized protein with GYD domain